MFIGDSGKSLALLGSVLVALVLSSCGDRAVSTHTPEIRIKEVHVEKIVEVVVTATPTAASAPTQLPKARGTDYTDLFTHVEHLWDQLAYAKENEDAEEVHTRLSSDLQSRCSLKDVENWLPHAGYFFFFDGVMAVFLDAANPHRGVAEMAGAVSGPDGEEMDPMSILMPMVWEEDDWRLVWPMDTPPVLNQQGQLVKVCPFAQ